jgi:hypothetical protein
MSFDKNSIFNAQIFRHSMMGSSIPTDAADIAARLSTLRKELAKELKVKEGLDRVMVAHASAVNKNAYNSVQLLSNDLVEDTQAKIASLRMQIDRLELALNGDQGNFE